MEPKAEKELVVVDDGSIPAEQLARLGLRPGARPLVVETIDREDDAVDLEGSLPDFPDLTWEDFTRGSEPARRDLAGA